MAQKWNNAVEQLLSALKGAGSIVLISHVSPDGDTLGSALAMKLALEKWGKEAVVCCQHAVPRMLSFLKGQDQVTAPASLMDRTFDLALAIDVADQGRMGEALPLFEKAARNAQVDHHGTNPGYAQVNLVDAQASPTAELIFGVIEAMGVEMDRETAICLYAGLSTDTGNFSFDCTTVRAFEIMGRLLTCGVPLNELSRVLFRVRTPEQTKLLGKALDALTFYEEGQIAGICLPLKAFEDTGALPEHSEGIVNYGIDVAGVKMAFLCRETTCGDIRVSLRALPPSNVAKVASRFGGGGHALAAGCTLKGSLQEAGERLVRAMKEEL